VSGYLRRLPTVMWSSADTVLSATRSFEGTVYFR
jgi:hypothetical protein